MTEISELKERLEKVEGRWNWELEEDIARWSGWKEISFPAENINGATENLSLWVGPDDSDEYIEIIKDEMRMQFSANMLSYSRNVPRYTSSLDAAVALVNAKLPGVKRTHITGGTFDITLHGKFGEFVVGASHKYEPVALLLAMFSAIEETESMK